MTVAISYRARKFAQLAGVTVRALHHYDRLGLLKPERTSSGYRVYRQSDLSRLEQIVALKFIGVPLKHIKTLLKGDSIELSNALSSQLSALEEKRRLIDVTIDAIRDAKAGLAQGAVPESSALKRIIEVIEMQNNADWITKYFREEVRGKLQIRSQVWTPQAQASAEHNWSDLFRDTEASLHEDPAGPQAQALVGRMEDLIRALTGDDQELVHGVKAMYSDRANWPAGFRARMERFTDERIWAFFRAGIAARAKPVTDLKNKS